MTAPLRSVEWLSLHLNDPDLIILDASFLANQTKIQDRLKGIQIKNARYFDLKKNFCDQDSILPNTLPSSEKFEIACQELGINSASQIIVYDNLGIYTSPRVWWLFRAMGHDRINVLDGGLPLWAEKGLPTEKIANKIYPEGNYLARFNTTAVRDYTFVENNSKSNIAVLIDARSKGRFSGTEPEPRKELQSGSVLNSINLPYTEVLHEGQFKSEAALTSIFEQLDLDGKPLIFSCGSGITACIILLAAELVIQNEKALYDGSWTEWATVRGLLT